MSRKPVAKRRGRPLGSKNKRPAFLDTPRHTAATHSTLDEQIAQLKTDYDFLKQAGHSPAKAGEIALDAFRGEAYALGWILALKQKGDDDAGGR